VHILFDFKWVHLRHHVLFKQIIDHPQGLTGIPTDLHILHQPKEWLAAFSSVEKAESAAPPYSATSKKRSIQGESLHLSVPFDAVLTRS
jgi:hypothetical protein